MIPAPLRSVLSPYLPISTPWERTNIRVERIPEEDDNPRSYVFRKITRFTVPKSLAIRNLETAGMSVGNDVIINPKYAFFETASGMALIGHELFHQSQRASIPGFDQKYEQAAMNTPMSRPWENPFELPAYQVEAEIYNDLVSQGYPAGDWVPLGVEVGLGG
ncbi:MAG: DUF4157 domain-containing protein [bacterium]|nr:DUF4157 domain-containing protein [bacterium]